MIAAIHGGDHIEIAAAIDAGDPFPGGRGFAGRLADGRIVRDVLGRYPVFIDDKTWSFDPTELTRPRSLGPGVVHRNGHERIWARLPSAELYESTTVAEDAVREALHASLTDLAGSSVAVAFSGGVDSSVVARGVGGSLYAVGFADSRDLAGAKSSAATLSEDVTVIELGHDHIRRAARVVVQATGYLDAMNVSIAIPLYLVAKRAHTDGFDVLALGQGADELFGGYEKIAQPDHRVVATTVRGARNESLHRLADQLERDVLTIRAAGIEPVFPLLDDRVVDAAIPLDDHHLVRDGIRKVTFRRAATDFVPATVADRPKTAIQYGSLVARELDRLARQAGFKRNLGNHVEQYLRTLVDSSTIPTIDRGSKP